jgi:hypothetical protein
MAGPDRIEGEKRASGCGHCRQDSRLYQEEINHHRCHEMHDLNRRRIADCSGLRRSN